MTISVRKLSDGIWGVRYAGFENGKRITGLFTAESEAKDRVARMNKARNRKTRPCMRCGKSFASEGIHNRLCGTCSHSNLDRGMIEPCMLQG